MDIQYNLMILPIVPDLTDKCLEVIIEFFGIRLPP